MAKHSAASQAGDPAAAEPGAVSDSTAVDHVINHAVEHVATAPSASDLPFLSSAGPAVLTRPDREDSTAIAVPPFTASSVLPEVASPEPRDDGHASAGVSPVEADASSAQRVVRPALEESPSDAATERPTALAPMAPVMADAPVAAIGPTAAATPPITVDAATEVTGALSSAPSEESAARDLAEAAPVEGRAMSAIPLADEPATPYAPPVPRPGTSDARYPALAHVTTKQWLQAETFAHDEGIVSDYADLWGALALGYCQEDLVARGIAEHRDLALFPQADMLRLQPDPQAYDMVPLDQLVLASMLPVHVDTENAVHILLADPTLPHAERVLRNLMGRPLRLFIVPRSYVDEQIRKLRGAGGIVDADRAMQELGAGRRLRMSDMRAAAEDSEIIEAINRILNTALEWGASDVHLEGTRDGMLIRARVDGHLRELYKIDRSMTGGDVMRALELRQSLFGRIFVMARQPIENAFHVPIDGRFEWENGDGRRIDIRLAALGTASSKDSLAVTLRLLNTQLAPETLDNRGFEPRLVAQVRQGVRATGGIIIVTGPTGSGKSTTLHAMLGHVWKPELAVITIENPVERKVPHFRQFEVRDEEASKLTYETILRSVLRQDPDIIMCGEIRDRGSAEIAMQAANTGHLLFTTLHTNTALDAVPRLRDLGITNFAIANEARLLMAQRLARRVCRHCAAPASAEDTQELQRVLSSFGYKRDLTWADVGLTAEDLADAMELIPPSQREGVFIAPPEPTAPITQWGGLRFARGCRRCRHHGYSGRLGIYSVVTQSRELRDAILTGQAFDVLERLAYDNGSRTLLANALLRVMRSETTLEEVLERIGPGMGPHSL